MLKSVLSEKKEELAIVCNNDDGIKSEHVTDDAHLGELTNTEN